MIMSNRKLNVFLLISGLLWLENTLSAGNPSNAGAKTENGNLICEAASGFEKPLPPGTMATLWNAKDTRITPDESFCGQHSLELTLSKKTKRVIVFPQGVSFKAGDVITGSAYLKGDQAGGPVLIYLWGTDKLWNRALIQKFSHGTVLPEWKQFKVTAKLTQDIKVLGVMIAGATAKGVSRIYIDEVKLERGTAATPSIPDRKNLSAALDRKAINLIPLSAGGQPRRELEISSFYQTGLDKSAPAPQKTSMFLSASPDFLFVRFRCEEAHPEKMVCRSVPDNPNWEDDRVELHLSLAGSRLKSSPDYFSINADGIFNTNLNVDKNELDIRMVRGKKDWQISFRLPLKVFGFSGTPGVLWRISAGRFHRTGCHAASALAPVKGHFNREENAFKNFVLSADGKLPDSILVSPGEMAEYANATGENLMVFDLPETMDFSGWKLKLGKQTVSPFLREKNQLSFLYRVDPVRNHTLNWQLLDPQGRPALGGTFFPAVFKPSCRVFTTPDPLFKELFGKKRSSERLHVSWGMPIGDLNYHQALKTGVTFSRDEVLCRLKNAGIRLLVHSAGELAEKLPEMRKGNYFRPTRGLNLMDLEKWTESGKALPCVWYSFYGIAGEDSQHRKGITWRKNGYGGLPLDPINRAAYLALAKSVAQNIRKGLKVYFFGDELTTSCSRRGLEMNTDFNRENHGRFLDWWNEDVKKKCGGGRFGIPWGMKRGTPERRPYSVAYTTYMASELAKLGLETRNIIRKINPALIMLSDDAYGNPSSQGVQYWKLYADCGSFQLGEGGGTSGQSFPDYMFTAKLVRDMSGLDELIVCPHEPVDGYPTGAMSSEEIVELFSQCVRGGATGFHFWPASYQGRSLTKANACSNVIGYPAAFEYMIRITGLFNRMPELKFPATGTAVLVADDAMISTSKFNRLRGAFRLIGLNPRGWFHFVSDTHLRMGWKNLNDYKLCYVPAGEVLRPETAEKLEQFVRNGGVLVCADPDFLKYNQFFDDASALREKLLGVTFQDSPHRTVIWNGGKITLSGKTCRLVPADRSRGKVLGTFQEDGTAAVYEHVLGKGKVICFGFDLFLEENAEKKEIGELFTRFHRDFGEPVGLPIWRFKFPVPDLPQKLLPAGKCLTGNYGFWDRHRFHAGRLENIAVPGKVIIQRTGEKALSQPFGKSRLTDRLRYFQTQETFDRKDGFDFTEKFGPGKHHIVFEFERNVSLGDMVLMHAGGTAEITVEKASGDQWIPVASGSCPQTGELEVSRKAIHAAAEGKRFRVTVQVKDQPFVLAETDLWGRAD